MGTHRKVDIKQDKATGGFWSGVKELAQKAVVDIALGLKANKASPTFTGTVSGVTKTHVGLSNVDNTSDANKPVSTAQQTALDLKSNKANPVFTGSISLDARDIDNTSVYDNWAGTTSFDMSPYGDGIYLIEISESNVSNLPNTIIFSHQYAESCRATMKPDDTNYYYYVQSNANNHTINCGWFTAGNNAAYIKKIIRLGDN